MTTENEAKIWNPVYECFDKVPANLVPVLEHLMDQERKVITAYEAEGRSVISFPCKHCVESIIHQAMRDGVDIDDLWVDNYNYVDEEEGIFEILFQFSFPTDMISTVAKIVQNLGIFDEACEIVDSLCDDCVAERGDEKIVDLLTGNSKTVSEIAEEQDVDLRRVLLEAEMNKIRIRKGLVLGEAA